MVKQPLRRHRLFKVQRAPKFLLRFGFDSHITVFLSVELFYSEACISGTVDVYLTMCQRHALLTHLLGTYGLLSDILASELYN